LDISLTALLGILLLALGFAAVFLMFHLWGYPFDHEKRMSAAPRWLMNVHRGIGFAYTGVYVVMMWQMVPRLFAYQVEFPARTVAHIVLAITIGFLIVVKITILRFFRHLEEWMPYIGVSLLFCTCLLLALSLPFAYKDRLLSARALGGDVASAANLERVKKQLATAEFPKEAPLDQLATPNNLRVGRQVLLSKCTQCHDLKTVLTRPRAPADWLHTVERMAERPAITEPIGQKQQWAVASYLIAISPDLQESAKRAREQQQRARQAKSAAAALGSAPEGGFDEGQARANLETLCTQCHELDELDKKPPKSSDDTKALLARMVDNGLKCDEKDLATIAWYLNKTYAKAN
jgi:hypothetical protein